MGLQRKVRCDGTVTDYKVRLVGQGWSPRQGLDCDEVFNSVVRPESVCALFAIAAKKNLVVYQMDVRTAVLNGNLKEEVHTKEH